MKRPLSMTALGLVLALGVASCAQPGEVAGTTAGTQMSVAEPMAQVASRVDNFRLVTADGHARELYRYKDAPAIVLVMHASNSADSAKAAAELAKLNVMALATPNSATFSSGGQSLADRRTHRAWHQPAPLAQPPARLGWSHQPWRNRPVPMQAKCTNPDASEFGPDANRGIAAKAVISCHDSILHIEDVIDAAIKLKPVVDRQ